MTQRKSTVTTKTVNETESDSERERTNTNQSEQTAEEICPECDETLVVATARGEQVCESCGLVLSDQQIDRGPDWRSWTAEERRERSRGGAPTTLTLHDRGISTEIGWRDADAYGNTLNSRQRQQMSRLRTWHQRSQTRDAKERNLKQALGEIDRMASALGMPTSVREMASVIYRRALEENLLLGRSIEGVATSALYAACRQAAIPRSLDEMAVAARVDKLEIGRTYRYLSRELGLSIEPSDPADFVPRFASELGIDTETEHTAIEILDAAAKEGLLAGKSPTGAAGAALYGAGLVRSKRVTQEEVSEVAGVTEVTIRNNYREYLSAFGVVSP